MTNTNKKEIRNFTTRTEMFPQWKNPFETYVNNPRLYTPMYNPMMRYSFSRDVANLQPYMQAADYSETISEDDNKIYLSVEDTQRIVYYHAAPETVEDDDLSYDEWKKEFLDLINDKSVNVIYCRESTKKDFERLKTLTIHISEHMRFHNRMNNKHKEWNNHIPFKDALNN